MKGYIFAIIFFAFLFVTSVFSQDEVERRNSGEVGQAEKTYEELEGFSEIRRPLYDPRGKRDPFKPFIKAPKEQEIVITDATPPLKKYSLDEFRITGIVWIDNEPKVVVTDPENNTYFLGKGDEIGNRHGVIQEIREDGIVVQEKRYFEDIFGNKKVEIRNSILAFVKEG